MVKYPPLGVEPVIKINLHEVHGQAAFIAVRNRRVIFQFTVLDAEEFLCHLCDDILFFYQTQEVTKNETQDTEEETSATPKPKKFAGSVSLFGGIDPFAEKKNLRSPSKEKAKCRCTPVL